MKKNTLSLCTLALSANCLLLTDRCYSQMVIDTFFFTGAQQTFVVPADVDSIFVDVRGA